jgi:hypothetical protein
MNDLLIGIINVCIYSICLNGPLLAAVVTRSFTGRQWVFFYGRKLCFAASAFRRCREVKSQRIAGSDR